MTLKRGNSRAEDFEHISNRDLIDSAHMLMGSIDLDPASSEFANKYVCLLYTSPSPRDRQKSRMPSSA